MAQLNDQQLLLLVYLHDDVLRRRRGRVLGLRVDRDAGRAEPERADRQDHEAEALAGGEAAHDQAGLFAGILSWKTNNECTFTLRRWIQSFHLWLAGDHLLVAVSVVDCISPALSSLLVGRESPAKLDGGAALRGNVGSADRRLGQGDAGGVGLGAAGAA